MLLIRHGETPTNVARQLETRVPGPDLTARGKQQARDLVARLDGTPIDAVYVSPLRRTRQTALPLLLVRDLPATQLPGLSEIEAGDTEGHTDPETVEVYHRTIGAWVAGDLGRRMPGAGTGEDFFRRFDDAVERIVADGHPSVLVVSSGAAIRAWVGVRAANLDLAFVAEHVLGNAGIVELDGDPRSGWTCGEWDGEPVTAGAADPTGGRFRA